MTTYADKLKDPRWQKKRLEIFKRDNWTCQYCGTTKSTLHVHHLCYIDNYEPWDYEDYFLITLCDNCHINSDNRNSSILAITSLLNYMTIEQIETLHKFIRWLSDIPLPERQILLFALDILAKSGLKNIR